MTKYQSIDDLNYELDHEGIVGDEDLGGLDEEDLKLIQPVRVKPKPPAKKPRKKKT